MYQFTVTIRETTQGHQVNAALSELLPGGGVAPLASRGPVNLPFEELWPPDPLAAALESLRQWALNELEAGKPIHVR